MALALALVAGAGACFADGGLAASAVGSQRAASEHVPGATTVAVKSSRQGPRGTPRGVRLRRSLQGLGYCGGAGVSSSEAAPAPGGAYSGIVSPDPPNSDGKSLNFGSPSFIGSTVSW